LAGGYGFYIEGAGGSGEQEVDEWFSIGETEPYDVDFTGSDLGFVLDTSVAKDKLFNYRLNVGLSSFDIEESGESDYSGLERFGLSIDSTFGFGVFRIKPLRLWIGPQIRVGFYGGETDEFALDVYAVTFGVAPVLGANVNLGRVVSLSLSTGYRIQGYAGEIDTPDVTTFYGSGGPHS
jgi:hypothetical protein